MKQPLPRLPDTGKAKRSTPDNPQTRAAEVISFRPQKVAETREKQKLFCGAEDLKLVEVCRGWSKVTKDDPDLLMNGIFAAYWQCAFDGGGQSRLFQWVSGKHCLNFVSGNVSYARAPAGNITATREKLPWPRSDLFLFLVAQEKSEGSGPLASRPSRTCKPTEDELRAMADRPIRTYPHDFLSIWLPIFHIARDDFTQWYTGSSLSAGAPLYSFCPGPNGAAVTRVEVDVNSERHLLDETVKATNQADRVQAGPLNFRAKSGSGRKPILRPEELKAVQDHLKEILDEEGEEDLAAINKSAVIKKIQLFISDHPKLFENKESPERTTIQTWLKAWLPDWKAQREQARRSPAK